LDLSVWFTKRGFYSIDWVIAGGESGPKCRPMHPDWASRILDQCRKARVPFHFKQWGHWVPAEIVAEGSMARLIEIDNERPVKMARLPKKEAGRILEGTTWNGLPQLSLVDA